MKRGWLPLALMTILIVGLGAYTSTHHSTFIGRQNLNSLLLATMPLALVSLGQATALLVGGFDISVGALMTMCVVTASFTLTPEISGLALIPGALALVGVGLATGIFNGDWVYLVPIDLCGSRNVRSCIAYNKSSPYF